MVLKDQLQGGAFDKALKLHTKRNSGNSLDSCNKTMRAILADLNINPRDLQADFNLYKQVRNKICDLAKTL